MHSINDFAFRIRGPKLRRVEASKLKKVKARETRNGLRGTQIRVLRVLAETNGVISLEKICDKLGVTATPYNVVGIIDDEKRRMYEMELGSPTSLLTLGYIFTDKIDIDGKDERVYGITDAGRDAVAAVADVTPSED
jgi:hypothetical protein